MKFSVVLALIAAATVVSAETNAQRLARGLDPNAPGKRATPVLAARHGSPSGYPGGGSQCNTGSAQCCNSVHPAGSGGMVDELLSKVGAVVQLGTQVGVSCTGIVGKGSDCKQQPVCCEGNSYSGIVNIGCSHISIL